MGVVFFGQFLIDRGIITAEQLVEALGEKDEQRLGAFAVAKGILRPEQLDAILAEQRVSPMSFTALALKRNMLTRKEIDYLLEMQKSDRFMLSRSLLDHGFVSHEALAEASREYDAQQSDSALSPHYLPPEFKGRTDMIAVIDMTEKLLLGLVGLPASADQATPYQGPSALCEFNSEIALTGEFGDVNYIVGCGRDLMAPLAAKMFPGLSLPIADAHLPGALGEFGNLVAGAASTALAARGYKVELNPPRDLSQRTGAMEMHQGVRWNVQTPSGFMIVLMG